MPRKYPLPRPNEWSRTESYTNDVPWDYLRLEGVWAYPPRIVDRPARKPKNKPLPDKPATFRCVEIRAFPKDAEGLHVPFPCSCRTAQGEHQAPEKKLHDKTAIRIAHRRLFNLPTFLVIDQRRFKCARCRKTFKEEFYGINTDIHMTEELRRDIYMTAIKRPFSDAEALLSVSEGTVRRTFKGYAATRLENYRFKLPRVMGVDEVFLFDKEKGNFVVVDLYKGRILEFAEGKTFEHLKDLFEKYDTVKERSVVKTFVQDMDVNYKLFAKDNFKSAKIVIDKFHVLMNVNKCMNQARIDFGGTNKKLTQELRDRRLLFITNAGRLSKEENLDRRKTLAAYPKLADPYDIQGRFYRIYKRKTRKEAEEEYEKWKTRVSDRGASHFYDVVKMVDSWHNEIFNYFEFRNRYNNGLVENLNGRMRRMYELVPNMTFETFRAKALLRYGLFHKDEEFRAYSLRGVPQNQWRRYADEGAAGCDGFDPELLFADLERGAF